MLLIRVVNASFRTSLLLLFLLMAGCTDAPPSNRSDVPSTDSNTRLLESAGTSKQVTPVAPKGPSTKIPSTKSQGDSGRGTLVRKPTTTESLSINYACESGYSLRVSYPDNDTAIVEYEGDIVQLASTVSGSGARYSGDGWVWWTQGDAGTLYRQANENAPEVPQESCVEGHDFAPKNSKVSLDNPIINPLTNVGPITRETSEGDLINLFGAENVEAILIPVGEGETVPGTRLFGGTPNAVDIEWKYTSQSPQRMTIRSGGTNWRTSEGLRIGSSLTDVTQVNGGAFDLTGFEWDYPGRTVDWQGGSLADALQLDFRRTQQIPTEELLYGEGPYSSQEPSMQKMGLVIEQISIRWD